MQTAREIFDTPLAGLRKADWMAKLSHIADEHGFFQRLGPRHFAAFIEDKPTLLVTFETLQGIRALDEDAQPLGWELVKALGWSHLAVVSDGDTWFRDDHVVAFFDRNGDDGFFDEFDRVIFYGAGPCGYAAAAFSVACPGAIVVAIQPQATLDPAFAGWDDRFAEERRRDFTTRYGYAPDMIEAASDAFILYDPEVTLDAMHASLFRRPNVTLVPLRHMGAAIQTQLMQMQLLNRILARAGAGQLSRQRLARMMRARRSHLPYLRNLLAASDARGHERLTERLCRHVTARMKAPRFEKRLGQLEAAKG